MSCYKGDYLLGCCRSVFGRCQSRSRTKSSRTRPRTGHSRPGSSQLQMHSGPGNYVRRYARQRRGAESTGWGKSLLRSGKQQEAIEIFKINARLSPGRVPSLAWAKLMRPRARNLAIENYEKALKLNPKNRKCAEGAREAPLLPDNVCVPGPLAMKSIRRELRS